MNIIKYQNEVKTTNFITQKATKNNEIYQFYICDIAMKLNLLARTIFFSLIILNRRCRLGGKKRSMSIKMRRQYWFNLIEIFQ